MASPVPRRAATAVLHPHSDLVQRGRIGHLYAAVKQTDNGTLAFLGSGSQGRCKLLCMQFKDGGDVVPLGSLQGTPDWR